MINHSKKILNLRKKIDLIDNDLCKKIHQRKKIVNQIMLLKLKLKLNKRDPLREEWIIKNLIKKYPSASKEISEIYKKLFEFSRSQA